MSVMKELLESLGVTKAAAARYFGVHRNTVAKWCDGKAPLAVTMVLEDMIDCLVEAEIEVKFAADRISGLRDA